jgi:hypothetical protein
MSANIEIIHVNSPLGIDDSAIGIDLGNASGLPTDREISATCGGLTAASVDPHDVELKLTVNVSGNDSKSSEYVLVELESVGTIQVRFKHAEPLSPREFQFSDEVE